uniref:HTH araC/xylS-type domain-containing protein n=1 Tax=Tanacetum cinerariifolium TaxID=118510 RepID=A0A699VJI2_TANCI|nr:hypothetical protein [Tanacetum cinerariifolium]
MSASADVGVTLLEMHARLARFAATAQQRPDQELRPTPPSELAQVERIAAYVAQHYSTPLTAAAIGQAVGMHPDYANAIFKKSFGLTLRESILAERIAHAQRRLVTTASSITAIAFDCGFNSISRFNAAFLQKNGCTPRQFRKQYRAPIPAAGN